MNLDGYKLGETDTLIELETAAENHDVALELIRQARQEICIVSYDLDPLILSHEDITEALSELVRNSRMARVRVLVVNSAKVTKRTHRLVLLAQRLSSRISVHKPGHQYRDYSEAFILADGIGYIRRQLADRFEGVASFKAPLECRDLLALFDAMWEHSELDPQLRRLRI